MTEEEAKKKWCPIRWREIIHDPDMTHAIKGALLYCAGPECMMWSWDQKTKNNPDYHADGYCGLAK